MKRSGDGGDKAAKAYRSSSAPLMPCWRYVLPIAACSLDRAKRLGNHERPCGDSQKAEAEAVGYRGCVLLSEVTGLSAQSIATWRVKLRLTNSASAGSLVRHQRIVGRGRKLIEVKDPEIVAALARMLSDEMAGDPMGKQQ
jgi:hypothetical protein